MSDRQRLLKALLRTDFRAFAIKVFQTLEPGTTFQPNWHHDAIAWQLEQVRLGKTRRLVINAPPRSAKSIYTSVAWCAFLHGRDPTKKIACLSYSNELASKLTRDYRTILQSDWYRDLFPATRISQEKNTEAEIVLTARGHRLTWSMTGTITGRGADIIIVDDPIKAEDAFSETVRNGVNERFDGTILSRQDNKATSAIVIVMQRLHPEDLAGHVLSKGGWTHLRIPAIAETEVVYQTRIDAAHIYKAGDVLHADREPFALLQQMRREAGEMRFSAQYQQTPIPPEGNLLKWAWFRTFEHPPDLTTGMVTQSWDTAAKVGDTNAYSACLTLLRVHNRHYLLNVLRKRLDYPALKQTFLTHARTWNAHSVLVEDAALGTALIQDLRQDALSPPIIPIQAERSKLERMAHGATLIEGGAFFIPTEAEWLDAFRSEVLQFPHGSFMDQVDALSQYLNWVKRWDSYDDGFGSPILVQLYD